MGPPPINDKKKTGEKMFLRSFRVQWSSILFLGLFPSFLHPQSLPLLVEQLGINEGLSAVDVRALLQDRYGFIWIGTLDGLDRYDGYGFSHYKHKPFEGTSLTANAITALYEDKSGTLWIGTVNGFCRMNAKERAAERFRQFQNDPADSSSLSGNVVSAICEDASGNIWVGTHGRGLNRLDPQTNLFTHYLARPGVPFGLNDNVITSLWADHDGTLWVGTMHTGLQKFEAATEKFLTYTWQHPNHLKKYERYLPAVFALVDSLQAARAPVASLRKIADSENRTSAFQLDTSAVVLIVATGEGINEPLVDRGWLEHAGTTAPVWQMRFDRTRHAGGALKNRILIETAVFPAGSYTLRYLSDDSHSFNHWNTRPPERPQDWGIQVFLIDAAMARQLKTKLQKTFLPAALSHHCVTAILPEGSEKNSVLWIGTANGLSRFDTQQEVFTNYFHDLADSNSLGSNQIAALCKGDSGKILIGTKTGDLHEFDTKRSYFRRFELEGINGRSLAQHRLHAVLKDRAGGIWIGTEDAALFKSAIKKFRHHHAEEMHGLTDREIWAFCEDREGVLWVGTADGLFAYDRTRSQYTHFKHDPNDRRSLSGNYVASIYEDEAGVLWIATWGAGLSRFERATKTFAHYRHDPKDPSSLSGDNLRSITSDHRGKLWIATAGNGLNCFDPHTGRTRRYQQDIYDPHSLPANDVFHLYVDRASTLWVGMALGGLAQFDEAGQRFKNFTYNPSDTSGLPNKTINHIYEDRDGRLWLGTYSGGLCRMQRHPDGRITFVHYTVDDGLPSNMIQGVVQDDDGLFWISTNNGLSRFDPGRPRGQQFRNYSVADGLQGKLFNRNALCKRRSGEIFFGGINGFNSFLPCEVKDYEYAPPVFLTQFRTFDQPARFAGPLASLDRIALGYEQNFFAFEFVALDFDNAANIQYAYKLEGLNDEWIHCGARRYASFTNVDPGEYVFRVKATNGDGVWGKNEAVMRISIAPPFWRTWWFYLASLGAILLAAYALFQYRLRAQVKKSLELERVRLFEREKVREQIARDYHDEMGHKITKVALFTELITRNVNSVAAELKEHLGKVVEASQSLSLDARDFIWALNPEKDSLYETCLHLQEFGNSLFEEVEVNFQVQGLSEELLRLKLNMEWKRHLTLLFKEGMNNALKHARCKNAVLEVGVHGGILRMSLHDDGVGLFHSNGHDPDFPSGVFKENRGNGAGLENMKRRAKILNGHLEIHAPSDGGTTVEFSSELPSNGY
jgi:ligand-binding sensor domain-containing protein/signal transduction histidine kinase